MSLSLKIPDSELTPPDGVNLSPLYPASIQQFDKLHWSPWPVIVDAVRFLAGNSCAEILDIGSGSGKFCLTGSFLRPDSKFYGVEQREYLVNQANRVKDLLDRQNVIFFHKNFTQVDLRKFCGFYFYNSFLENMPGANRIDESIDYSPALYQYYSLYLQKQLEVMPVGTRVATYCSLGHEIPPDYQLKESHMEDQLKFWTKL
jgi:Putative methyltransferase